MYQANDTVPESINREPSARRHQSTCKVLNINVEILRNFNRLKKYFLLAISFEHASRLPPPVRFMRRVNKKNPESTGHAVADAEPWRPPVNDLEARLRQRETSRYRWHYNRIVGMENTTRV